MITLAQLWNINLFTFVCSWYINEIFIVFDPVTFRSRNISTKQLFKQTAFNPWTHFTSFERVTVPVPYEAYYVYTLCLNMEYMIYTEQMPNAIKLRPVNTRVAERKY